MLSKTERLTESVIKSVLEILRNHADVEFTELQIEQGTREKIISKQAILDRLRNNPKIHYDSVTGRYRFKPSYPISNREDLLSFLQRRSSLVVDSDLVECYKTILEDISDLLVSRQIRAIRQADIDRNLKCERTSNHSALIPDGPQGKLQKCSVYATDRCSSCSSNRGLVLMKIFEKEIEFMKVDSDLKQFWLSVKLPHISEIHRLTQSASQHLLTMNTSQLLSNKAVRKVRGKRGPQQSNSKFNWSEINANRLSNDHILGLLEGHQ